jgi:nitrite reductase/ring-hydroxylating ferredoxin subunit
LARNAGTLKQSEPEAPIAVYRRLVAASLERVWENVLDWEHLPWLHASSFTSIDLVEADAEGWRAKVDLAVQSGPTSGVAVAGTEACAEIEVRLDRPNLRYTTRTLSGVGEGTEIVTQLEPVEGEGTRIEVEFYVPGVERAHADAVGESYRSLYARLWDEDEAMMVHRQRFLDERSRPHRIGRAAAIIREPISFGKLKELRERLPMFLDVAGHPYRIVEIDGRPVMHSAVCPHLGGPLDSGAIEDGLVSCPWHGYRFDLCTGKSADGRKLRLAAGPRLEVDEQSGEVRLLWS